MEARDVRHEEEERGNEKTLIGGASALVKEREGEGQGRLAGGTER